MSAESLRRAAALMRERAEAATPGPWGVGNGSTVAAEVEQLTRGSFRSRAVIADLDSLARDDYDDVGQVEADAAHIASWHPAVALAVADLLTAFSMMPSASDPTDLNVALAVARAYLGEQP